jgi:hypothetical protein
MASGSHYRKGVSPGLFEVLALVGRSALGRLLAAAWSSIGRLAGFRQSPKVLSLDVSVDPAVVVTISVRSSDGNFA